MPVIGITPCPHCGGQFIVDKVPAFSGCINCGFDGPPGKPAVAVNGKWPEVVADGWRLGWEATVKKWGLGKTAKKRLKRDLANAPAPLPPLAATMLAMGKERRR